MIHLDRRQVIEEIRSSWKQIYEVDSKNGIICPLCKSGSKKKGTGITGDENHGKPYSLKCWACGFQGDVIDLYQKETGLDFNTAIKELSERINITLDSYDTIKKPKPVSIDKKYIKKEIITINSGTQSLKEPRAVDFTEYYKKCKKKLKDPMASSYLLERGISIETAAKFSIGFDLQSDPAQSGHKSPRIIIPINKHHYIGRSVDPNMNVLYSKMNNKGATPGIFNLDALYKKMRLCS